MSHLLLKQVNKIYELQGSSGVHAVKDLSLEVKHGEIIALLGSSGCGKTSTLRMVAGFESVSSGVIELNSRQIHTLLPAQRKVAMAFEGYSLYPPLSVKENIVFALKSSQFSKKEIEKTVGHVTELLEIQDLLDSRPASLSGGQQQRVSLARALVKPADVYLLDEPMGQLEPQLRSLLRVRIKQYLKEEHKTAIMVTHNQTEANALADRIAVMEGGILQDYNTSKHLQDTPANLFVGTFLGEPPMNVIEAKLSIENNELKLFLQGSQDVLKYDLSNFSSEQLKQIEKNTEVILGVRPHFLQLGSGDLKAKLISNQWLGDQVHLATKFCQNSLVIVSHTRQPYQYGEMVPFSIPHHALHFFDTETQNLIF